MIRINENYLKLQSSYLFSIINKKVASYCEVNPEKRIIKMGIGDVTRALPPVCISAFKKAAAEMSIDETFRGYGPEQGYPFLRERIVEWDFKKREVDIKPDEIFISDGSKCDSGNIQELFANNIKIGIPDPVYPVFIDTNVMAGRTGEWENDRYKGIVYLESNEQNNFVPAIPEEKLDLIYLCFPNNPTGATISKEELKKWIEYAEMNKALILYDAAYVAFIRDKSLPQSIYEIEGAENVAIEFRSFSKTAGFTGTRCAYTVVPHSVMGYDSKGDAHSLNTLWNRRHTTKFNGVAYPVQRAAEAVYTKEGQKQVKELIDYYLANADMLKKALDEIGLFYTGGANSPYIWIKTGIDSWKFFDLLLNKAGVVCTPGSGFGRCGEGYVRLSAFNSHENVEDAIKKIKDVLKDINF